MWVVVHILSSRTQEVDVYPCNFKAVWATQWVSALRKGKESKHLEDFYLSPNTTAGRWHNYIDNLISIYQNESDSHIIETVKGHLVNHNLS